MIDSLENRVQYINNAFEGTKRPVVRNIVISEKIRATLIFLDELTDSNAINRDLLRSLMQAELNETDDVIKRIEEEVVPFGEVDKFDDINMATGFILDGAAVLVAENCREMLAFSAKKWSQRGVDEPPTSSVIRGPREGFNEDIKTNISLIRRRLKTPDLTFDIINVGKYSSTKVAVVYINSIADKNIVKNIKNKINGINIDGILDSAYVEAFLQDNRKTIFSQVGITEKPDIASGKLLEGRVCVIVDGCPSVLTLPYLFIESFQDSGDYYGHTARRNFLRALRMVCFLFALLLPGFYVSMLLFHYEMLPTDLLLTIVNARDGIPMNPMLELLVTMVLFEMLQEASVRMPRHIGAAMSIVGALILGDTAVSAGVISSPAVMVSAVSSIMIYNVPEQSDVINMLRFVFTILAGFIGFFGLIVGVIAMCLHLLSLTSVGVPFMAPYAPLYGNDKQDALFLKPVTQRFLRPESIPTKNRVRMKHSK